MMKNKIRAEFRPDSIDLVNFIINHFRVFLFSGIAAVIVSAVVSLLIKPLYESSVTLYPSSNISETRTLLGEAYSEATLFGDDDATEKLLQVINSERVMEYLKQKYDLAAHYRIKPDEKYPNTLVAEKMDRYIHSSKTPFGSVEIKVRDRDREIACAMANDIAAQSDTIFNAMQRSAASKMLEEISRSYEAQDKLVRQYEDSLQVLDGASVLRTYSNLETESEYLGLIRGKYLEALALSQQTMPYTLVVDRAVVAEKKAYPHRSIMVIVSTISVLILVALILFFAEGLKVHRADERR